MTEVESLERARYEEAALTAAELARTAAEVQEARFQASAAEAAAIDARAALAALTALPPARSTARRSTRSPGAAVRRS